LECHRIRNLKVTAQALAGASETENLDELDPTDVFLRCLEASQVPEADRPELVAAYTEIRVSLQETDLLAE
jgi:exonuclease SbcD